MATDARETTALIGSDKVEGTDVYNARGEQSALRADSENLSPVLRDRLVARLRRTCPV